MKLKTLLIGGFVTTILVISIFAYISAVIVNNNSIEIFREHYQEQVEEHGRDLVQIEKDMASKLRTIYVLFIIISLLLSIIIGYILNYIIVTPIKRLSRDVDEISKGNLEIEIDNKTLANKNEIGDLAHSLNRIITTMKLAILRRGPAKKDIKTKSGISEKDLVKSGLVSKSKDEKKINKKSEKVEKNSKKPLVTFPSKNNKESI